MRKRTKIILASSAIFAIVVGTVGVSQAGRSGSGFWEHSRHGGHRGGWNMAEKIFDKFDVDGDGAISRAEIEGVRKKELAGHDTDKNGSLNLEEFQALWVGLVRDRMVDHFQRLDNDGDAQVTEAEIARPMDMMMSRLDRNNDGKLTKNELRRTGMHHRRDDSDDDKK